MHSPEVWEQPRVPLPQENALLGERPLQLQALTFWFAAWLFVGALIPVVLYDGWIGG